MQHSQNPSVGPVELAPDDFTFEGPLGSQGARIERIGTNHFRVLLGAAPEHPEWSNKLQFTIQQHAKGNSLRLDVEYPEAQGMWLNEYSNSYSYDSRNWQPVHWDNGYQKAQKADTMRFPVFEEDRVYVGHQVPMSYEDACALVEKWRQSPFVAVHRLGKSLEGRDLHRVEITDPHSDVPRAERWVHHFSNQHPGEHNSQWRMVGMAEWLLSDEGAAARRRSISHFILFMSPDAPSHGWYRVNGQGVDMNRSYRAEAADAQEQAHEAYLCQKDLEALMASDAPVTDLWGMHTWSGIVEPLLTPGPEMGRQVGEWTELRDIIARHDTHNLIKPLDVRESSDNTVYWTAGPHQQFGISVVLCEGAGAIYTQEDNVETGAVLMKGIAEYYGGTRNR